MSHIKHTEPCLAYQMPSLSVVITAPASSLVQATTTCIHTCPIPMASALATKLQAFPGSILLRPGRRFNHLPSQCFLPGQKPFRLSPTFRSKPSCLCITGYLLPVPCDSNVSQSLHDLPQSPSHLVPNSNSTWSLTYLHFLPTLHAQPTQQFPVPSKAQSFFSLSFLA